MMVRIEWPLHVVRRVVAAVVAAAVLGVGGWYAVSWVQETNARCAAGVVKRGEKHECVGVTDGAYKFAGDLKTVETKIKAENDRVTKDKDIPYVSVAYMTSFTLTDTDTNSMESVRHELEGAYLAQQQRNLDATPRIRLLIANTGSHSAQWKHTVGELIDNKDKNRLVAVTGLGPSTDENLAAIRKLSAGGLALVASTMTADNIRDIKNLVRVTPTNTDEAAAAAAFLKRNDGYATAQVVKDAAKDDLYANTLAAAFPLAYRDAAHSVPAEAIRYNNSPGQWKNELNLATGQLCEKKPKLIYFAGRGIHLTEFLRQLARRYCQDQKFTVMTGDDITNLTRRELTAAAGTGIPVLYTGLAHPDMLLSSGRAVAPPVADFFTKNGQMSEWFKGDHWDDGQAMMAHDAVLTAATGATMASTGQTHITGNDVAGMFQHMTGTMSVKGASGFLTFDVHGNAVDKAVPILKLGADGTSTFVEVSSAHGAPGKAR